MSVCFPAEPTQVSESTYLNMHNFDLIPVFDRVFEVNAEPSPVLAPYHMLTSGPACPPRPALHSSGVSFRLSLASVPFWGYYATQSRCHQRHPGFYVSGT